MAGNGRRGDGKENSVDIIQRGKSENAFLSYCKWPNSITVMFSAFQGHLRPISEVSFLWLLTTWPNKKILWKCFSIVSGNKVICKWSNAIYRAINWIHQSQSNGWCHRIKVDIGTQQMEEMHCLLVPLATSLLRQWENKTHCNRTQFQDLYMDQWMKGKDIFVLLLLPF